MSRKQITITLKITAPSGMDARCIKREVLTRINDVRGHYDAVDFGLPDGAEDDKGHLKVKASLAKVEGRA